MAKKKNKKRGTGGKIIVFLVLLLMLAALLFWKVYSNGSWSDIKEQLFPTSANPPQETVEIVYHTPSPSPEADGTGSSAAEPDSTGESSQGAVAVQNQGSVEIIMPDDMDSAGF